MVLRSVQKNGSSRCVLRRDFFAGLLWTKARCPGGQKQLFAVTGVEVTDQCPCLVDKDGTVDGVQYILQAAHKSGARYRWAATRHGASLPRLLGQYSNLYPEFDLSDSAGASVLQQIFPSIAAVASRETLQQCSAVLMTGEVAADLQLHNADVLARRCLQEHAPDAVGAPLGDRVVAMGRLEDRATVVDLCGHALNCSLPGDDTTMPQLATILPLPTGVSDFALSSACSGTDAGEAPAWVRQLLRKRQRDRHTRKNSGSCADAPPITSKGPGTLARRPAQSRRKHPATEHEPTGWKSARKASAVKPRTAPLSTVMFETLRDGMQVAWVPETSALDDLDS